MIKNILSFFLAMCMIINTTLLLASCITEPQENQTTQSSTEAATEAPTEESGEDSTEKATEEPTTDEPTNAPTEEGTTEEATEEPTDKPTADEPTVESTDESTEEFTTDYLFEESTTETTDAIDDEPTTEETTEISELEIPEYENGALFLSPELLAQDIDYDIDWTIDRDYVKLNDEALSIMFREEPATFTFIANYMYGGAVITKGEAISIGNARYLLIKYRVSDGIGALSVSVNSESQHNASSISLPVTIPDGEEWNVAIVDMLYCLSPSWIQGRKLNTLMLTAEFSLESYDDAVLEIAGIGFYQDFDAIIANVDDDRATYLLKNNKSAFITIADQKCVECGTWATESRESVGDNCVITYNCAVCGEEFFKRSYPNDVTFYMGGTMPYSLEGTVAREIYIDDTHTFGFTRYTAKSSGQAFIRLKNLDAGNLKRYLVFKLRLVGDPLYMGSTWASLKINNNTEPFMDGVSVKKYKDEQLYNEYMNLESGIPNSEEWMVLVYDLFIEGSPYSSEDVLDDILLHTEKIPVGWYADIAVVANCSDWGEIDALIDDDIVDCIIASNGFGTKVKISEEVNKTTTPITQAVEEITDAESGEIVERKYTYTVNEEVISTITIPANINMYLTPGQLVGTDGYMYSDINEHNLVYYRYSNIGQKMIGQSFDDNMPLATGRYLVLKMRGPSAGWFSITVNGCANMGMSLTPFIGKGIDQWQVFVLDLESSVFEKEDGTRCAGKDIPITSIQTDHGASVFDVAYIAICDSWAEIDSIVDRDGVMLMTADKSGDLLESNVNISDCVAAESSNILAE